MDNFESLIFVNSSGETVELSTPTTSKWWELRGRTGFTAPDIEIISQKYANGITKVLKRIVQPRIVAINMVITGDTTAERDTSFFAMIARLMNVNGGDIGRLYVRRSDGMVVYLNCTYSSGLSITEEYRKFHRFTLEFYAADPYFYRDLDDVTISVPDDGKLVFGDLFIFGQRTFGELSGSGSGIIVNDGSESLQPVIKSTTIYGSIVITNETTGDEISLTGISVPIGSTLVIDTRDESKSIYIEDAEGNITSAGQYLDWQNMNFDFPIVPGNNAITFTFGAGSKTDSILFEMSTRYLSA